MKNKSISRFIIRIFLFLYSLLIIIPVFWMIYSSFKTSKEYLKNPWALPTHLEWANFTNAWTRGHLGEYAVNSVIVVTFCMLIITFATACTSYVLARFPFKGSALIENTYMGALLLPGVVAMAPIFLLLKDMHLVNTFTGIILILSAASLPFSCFIMVGFFRTLPKEYEEAASIDGCGYFRAFWQIMLPLARTGLVTIFIFNFIGVWNDYAFSLILLTEESKKTIQIGLIYLSEVQRYQTDWGALFAGLTMVTIPVFIVYSIFQEKITEGLATGGLKG